MKNRKILRFLSCFLFVCMLASAFQLTSFYVSSESLNLTASNGYCYTAKTDNIDQATAVNTLIKTECTEETAAKIEDIIFNAEYRLTVLGGKEWPYTNNGAYATSLNDSEIGTVNWGWRSKGCFSYAQFVSKYVHNTVGSTVHIRDKVALAAADPSASEIKDFITSYADPGEHIHFYYTSGGRNSEHSIVYLAGDSEGFYFLSENGNNPQIMLYYATYEKFDDIVYSINGKINGDSIWIFDTNNGKANIGGQSASIERDLILVLDVSGSMSGTKLTNTKIAATSFIEQALKLTDNTKIGIVEYATDASMVCDLTDDKDILLAAVNSLYAYGMTNVYDGLEIANDMLSADSEKDVEKKGIVLMTDGDANEGTYSSTEGVPFNCDGYGAAIYNLTQGFHTAGYNIYTLGFGLSAYSYAYTLLKNICTDDYFWSVTSTNVNDLVFAFGDVMGSVITDKSIVVTIECPVDVKISRGTEYLDSLTKVTTASFGEMIINEDVQSIRLELEYFDDYVFEITGNGTGTMDFTIEFTEGDVTTLRSFINVPITPGCFITLSSTNLLDEICMYLDVENDGTFDQGWSSAIDEVVDAEEADDTNIVIIDDDFDYTPDTDDDDTAEDDEPIVNPEVGLITKLITKICELIIKLIESAMGMC